MKPQKALELVLRYSHLTKTIKGCTRRIGEHLERCNGISGKRQDRDQYGVQVHEIKVDAKNREVDLHLVEWYKPYYSGDHYYPTWEWQHINELEHKEECPHCYAAHLAIQERKQARKQLGAVKAAMSRSTA
jgi:hypothetical protein